MSRAITLLRSRQFIYNVTKANLPAAFNINQGPSNIPSRSLCGEKVQLSRSVNVAVRRGYSTEGGQIAGLFKTIEGALDEKVVASTNAMIAFDVTGEEAGKWFLDLKNGAGACGQGEPPSPSDVTLTLKSDDMVKMFTGKLNPTQAFMSGKLKLKGNMGKAMALEKLMKKMK